MMFHNVGYGMGGWGMLFMFLFWAGLILLLLWGLRSLVGPATSRNDSISAGEIVDQRYAAGEISREEYQKIKKDLAG